MISGFSPVRSRERFLVFGAPSIEEEEIAEVVASLRSGWIGTGPKVARLQEEFVRYKGGERIGVAVNSCTAALHLSMLVAGLQPGDEVITTALTFCSTVNAIIHAGATPVLADVDPATMNIDPVEVERKITPRTRALIPVHFAGRACAMDQLCALSSQYGLKMVEDCAHAIETQYHGRPAGTFGDFGCFSFYVTKNMTTVEGGMILAANSADADRLKVLTLHGMSRDAWKRYSDEGYKHYQVVNAGFKYNMTDLAASLGLHQLARIERGHLRRRQIWQKYKEAFCDLPLGLPAEDEPENRHALHLYTVLIDEKVTDVSRDAFLDRMTAHHIGIGVHYLSIPEHPFYQERLRIRPEDYPKAMRIGRQTVSLPLAANLSDEDVEDVILAVRRSLQV